MSQTSGSALPPAFSISAAAVWMVPSSLGCGSVGLGGDRDVGAVARRAQGDRQADAAAGAGDEQRLALEPRHRWAYPALAVVPEVSQRTKRTGAVTRLQNCSSVSHNSAGSPAIGRNTRRNTSAARRLRRAVARRPAVLAALLGRPQAVPPGARHRPAQHAGDQRQDVDELQVGRDVRDKPAVELLLALIVARVHLDRARHHVAGDACRRRRQPVADDAADRLRQPARRGWRGSSRGRGLREPRQRGACRGSCPARQGNRRASLASARRRGRRRRCAATASCARPAGAARTRAG